MSVNAYIHAEVIPDLVILDLNLPRENGFAVLEWLRQQQQFASLPVVVYTSSVDAGDCAKAYRLGANDYVVKLSNLQGIANLARQLNEHWLRGVVG
jgi:CheY-like chemotaxis protein